MAPFVSALVFVLVSIGLTVASTARADLVIRMYQVRVSSPTSAAELQQQLARLLAGFGFDVAVVDCFSQSCANPLAAYELALRLVGGRHPDRPDVCGMAQPGTTAEPGVLMTVYHGCVAQTARELQAMAVHPEWPAILLKVTEADVLAPIVVHEMIHLLLPDEPHGTGLWKPHLHLDDWPRALEGALHLESALGARLRTALATRTAMRAIAH